MEQHSETIAALNQQLTALRDQNDALAKELQTVKAFQQLLLGVIDNAPCAISVRGADRRLVLVNQEVERSIHMERAQLLGKTEEELFGTAAVAQWADHDRQVVEERRTISSEAVVPGDSGDHIYLSHKFPLTDENGDVCALASIVMDITAQKRAEADRHALQERVIEAQQIALRELSTPLIPIVDGVVAMPLVGTIDSWRAQMIMEALLEGISNLQAEVAILDITGVRVVDTQVASALLRAAQAAQLLGARVMLTGIGAEVAQSLVHLGADLSRIEIQSTLQAGVAAAIQQAAH
jgi:PAS domain S-box-containing protein